MPRPKRTFSADVGQKSIGTAGPDQIEYDLDQLFAMFDPDATLPDGVRLGGVTKENVREGIATLNGDGRVEQDSVYSSDISGFSPATVKAALDALAGVRIVEMGSNSNGEYVRWENGLQICMAQRLLLSFYNSNHMMVNWTLPAAFVAADYVPLALYDFNEEDDTYEYSVKSLQARNKSTTRVTIDLLSSGRFQSSDIRRVSVLAIGRWK